MDTIVRGNERSWAIEIISKINEIASSNDWLIKCAGGERTVSVGRKNKMFPDVILYGNREQSIFLQGWELKMPDTPIEDETFIKDAQRKANALSLNSCLVWNFTYAVLYVQNEDGKFKAVASWNDTSFIKTRQDVQKYRIEWEQLLKKVLTDINSYLLRGSFRRSFIENVVSNMALTTLIQRNQSLVADLLREEANRNSVISAYIGNWWLNIKKEYEHDEIDMFNAYAKSILLNWANRITFAHIIKYQHNTAMKIDSLQYSSTPDYANQIFFDITQKSDFYNVFAPVEYGENLPELTWHDFVEYSSFLKTTRISKLNHNVLQSILEHSVSLTKRAFNGQFTTPFELAKILVRLTVIDWKDNFMDCCCGTGTIAKAAIEIKKKKFEAKIATETVWASDKYRYPLQTANISMTSADTMNMANRLFQKNALDLHVGDKIEIVNPENGKKMQLELPTMGAVASNLPFVEFERLPDDDLGLIREIINIHNLDSRSDLYFYITLKIADILKPGGRLGIITSNSWLGTESGTKFITALHKKYDILQIHISGKGRWFKNADIVTTIIILKKKENITSKQILFFIWKKTLEELSNNAEFEEIIVNSSLLEQELNSNICEVSSYEYNEIEHFMQFNISYNSFFHHIDWLSKFHAITIPINNIFNVIRGSRRGWDALFYPKVSEHHIEKQYLGKVLLNARNIEHLTIKTSHDAFSEAFCCNVDIEELKKKKHDGALEWIQKFIHQNNKVGKPLTQSLKRNGMYWYELKTTETAEFFTLMNPDQRIFFTKIEDDSAFLNQRLIGLNRKQGFDDAELYHALLNSLLTSFSIESSGFGRGLGALDINKDRISRCMMFNPNIISTAQRNAIVKSFQKIKTRKILPILEELNSTERLEFEKIVFSAYGVENELESLILSLKSMINTRATARRKVET